MRWIGQVEESEKIIAEARALFIEAGRAASLMLLLIDWGIAMIYSEQGNYIAAEKMYESAQKRNASRFWPSRDFTALITFGLASVHINTGKPNPAKEFLQAVPFFKKVGSENVVVLWVQAAWAE
ncbi:hypothetical protein H0H92_002433, partial [Tricholoma furcatifolium]